MGYQESLIRVKCLAEVSGIHRAIEESEEVKTLEYLLCCGAARAKRDLYGSPGWPEFRTFSEIKENETPLAEKGSLFAVVAGARLYQSHFWIDSLVGIDDPGYGSLLESIPLEEAYKEAELYPEAARRAEVAMRRRLNGIYTRIMKDEHPIRLPDEYLDSWSSSTDFIC